MDVGDASFSTTAAAAGARASAHEAIAVTAVAGTATPATPTPVATATTQPSPTSAAEAASAEPEERVGNDRRDPVWPFEPPPFPYTPNLKVPNERFTSPGYVPPEPRAPRAAANPVLESTRFKWTTQAKDPRDEDWAFRLDQSLLHGAGVGTSVPCGETVTIGLELRDWQGKAVNVLLPDLLGPWLEVRIDGPASTMHYMQAVSRDGEPGRFEADFRLPLAGQHKISINAHQSYMPRRSMMQSLVFSLDVVGSCPSPPTRRCTADESLVAKDDGYWTQDDRYHFRDCLLPRFSRQQAREVLTGFSFFSIGSSYARELFRSVMSLIESREWALDEEARTRYRPKVKRTAELLALGVARNAEHGDRRSHYTTCSGPDSCDLQSWQYRDLRDYNFPDFPLPSAERLVFLNEGVMHDCIYRGTAVPVHPWLAEEKTAMLQFTEEIRRLKWYCLDAQLSLAARIGGVGRYFFFPVHPHLARKKVKYGRQQLIAYLADVVAHEYWTKEHPNRATMMDVFALFRTAPERLIAPEDGHHFKFPANEAAATLLLNWIDLSWNDGRVGNDAM